MTYERPSHMPPLPAAVQTHMDRIAAGAQRRAAEQASRAGGLSSAEQHAARVLPGYRADAELREEARRRELAARGLLVEDELDVEGDDEEQDATAVDDEPEPGEPRLTTGEVYAARAGGRDSSERRSARQAYRNVAMQAAQTSPLDSYLGRRPGA